MEKIVFLDGYTNNPGDLSWDCIKKYGEFKVYDKTNEDQIDSRLENATIVLTNKTKLSEKVLKNHKSIKYIGVMATGYDVVDINYCKKNNICVCNIPSYSTNAVAQMTFALILEATSLVSVHNTSVHNGDWQNSEHFCYWKENLCELNGKTLGVIGNGSIAKAVIKIAIAFNMNIIVYQRHNLKDTEFVKYRDLDYLYKNSDIISIHVPSTDQTRHMINSESISKMKDNVILVNTARGNIVNSLDVNSALDSNKIKYYCSDVLETEPPKDNPLQFNKRSIITPHIAWAAIETRERLLEIAGNNIKQFLNGNIINCVSK